MVANVKCVDRVLVCGGRDFSDVDFVYRVLDRIQPKLVIHGAARGADSIAEMWADERAVPLERYPADWKQYGRRAGPIRNAQMLREGKPTLVVAFPGGRGTAHMVNLAFAAGVEIVDTADEWIGETSSDAAMAIQEGSKWKRL